MKKKSTHVTAFLTGLHEFIINDPQFRKKTSGKSEVEIQTELRPLIIRYLEKYFDDKGYKDSTAKANQSFYWEGQEGQFGRNSATTFGARNYPDFIITFPYLVAIEYKQSASGSLVKQGIGQSLMHTLCGDFDFVYYLFHDQSPDKRIEKSISQKTESEICKLVWNDFNILVRFV